MKVYEFKRKQNLPVDIETAWKFFSDPGNLAVITPPWLNFRIKSNIDEPMFEGMIIEYKISPLPGISTKWITKITSVKKPYYFVDEQISGPYKLWRHQHKFHEVENGIEMIDIVSYSLPFGLIGRLLHKLFVRKKIEEIFKYRKDMLERRFGKVDQG